MAEKEERIRIEQFEYEGFGHCAGFSTDGEGYYCEFSGESIPITKEICEKKCPYDSSISRQEAIERMAKARYAQRPCYDKKGNEISFEDAKENYQLFYEDLIKEVEPLLNALLEGK